MAISFLERNNLSPSSLLPTTVESSTIAAPWCGSNRIWPVPSKCFGPRTNKVHSKTTDPKHPSREEVVDFYIYLAWELQAITNTYDLHSDWKVWYTNKWLWLKLLSLSILKAFVIKQNFSQLFILIAINLIYNMEAHSFTTKLSNCQLYVTLFSNEVPSLNFIIVYSNPPSQFTLQITDQDTADYFNG